MPDRDRAAYAQALAQAVGHALDAVRQQMAARGAGVAVEIRVLPGGPITGLGRARVDLLAERRAHMRAHMEVVAVGEPEQPGTSLLTSVFVLARAVSEDRGMDTPSGRPPPTLRGHLVAAHAGGRRQDYFARVRDAVAQKLTLDQPSETQRRASA
jgi:hypothetical protein